MLPAYAFQSERRPALLESGVSIQDAEELLADVFAGFEMIQQRTHPASVVEERGQEEYTLSSTLLTWIGRRPEEPSPAPQGGGDQARLSGEHPRVDR